MWALCGGCTHTTTCCDPCWLACLIVTTPDVESVLARRATWQSLLACARGGDRVGMVELAGVAGACECGYNTTPKEQPARANEHTANSNPKITTFEFLAVFLRF